MATHQYALVRGGPKRLEITYSLGIRSATIRLDGKDIGRVESRQALNEGRDFKLPDGSILRLHFFKNGFSSQLRVLQNGVPVPDSPSDPETIIKNTYWVLFFVAAVNILIGLSTTIFHFDLFSSLSSGWFTVILGAVFFFLAFAVRDRRRAAVIIALVIFVLDSGLWVWAVLAGGLAFNPGPVIVRGYILLALTQGLRAINQIDYDPPSKGNPSRKSKPRSWTTLEKGLTAVVILLGLTVTALAYILLAPKTPTKIAAQATFPSIPDNPATIYPPTPTVVFPSDYPPLQLNLKAQEPQKPVNLRDGVQFQAMYPGDEAWNRPTFANAHYADGYPSSATTGGSGWRSAGSNGSWFYVDLVQPQQFRQIIVSYFVDANATNAPHTYYIASDDLVTWRVIVDEINRANSTMRFKPRVLTLPQNMSARYVGMYAANWHGGWGGVQTFAVIAPGWEYVEDAQQGVKHN